MLRDVWTIVASSPGATEEAKVVLRTTWGGLKSKNNQFAWAPKVLKRAEHDALVSDRAGPSPAEFERTIQQRNTTATRSETLAAAPLNVMPVYQYCAFSSVAPFAAGGTLGEYIKHRKECGDLMSAEELYSIARQMARGLHQTQLYDGGRATHVHGDLKPEQFLLLDRPDTKRPKSNAEVGKVRAQRRPTLLLGDFNSGQFLRRSRQGNETRCTASIPQKLRKSSPFQSPEEHYESNLQTDAIDVFSLGGVLFFLLSDGHKAWFHWRGKEVKLPSPEWYKKHFNETTVAAVELRSRHPAFVAIVGIMVKCLAVKAMDRPSSQQVVRWLEESWQES